MIRLANILREEATGDCFVRRRSARKEVDAGRAEVGSPSDIFGPWAGGEVQGENGKEFFEFKVELGRILDFVLHEVEVVVGVNRGEGGADGEDVTLANE